jgi:hypothetical protein
MAEWQKSIWGGKTPLKPLQPLPATTMSVLFTGAVPRLMWGHEMGRRYRLEGT